MSRELEPPSAPAEDPRLVQAVQEYLQALETGRRLDRQVFRERFPDLADSMAPYFDAVDLLQAAAPVLRSSLGAGPSLVTDGEPPAEALGDFRIVREVGRGGMGVVYEAIQRSLGRRVALKVLPFAATLDARQLQRFKNEAQAAAHLHHPNIVPVYAVGCERGVHYYAMQLIDGHNLATIIEEMRRHEAARRATVTAPQSAAETRPDLAAQLSTQRAQRAVDFFRTAARLLAQAADALDYAHGFGVVHRDVKPANLLVDEHGNIWITDFGLAQFHADGGLTQSGDLLGTLRYMSPEQSGGQRASIDQRIDVYSLGATLYELLTLRPIFDGTDRQILLRQILHDEPRPPRSLDRSMPPELETIVLKAVAKAPTERYATARELADDLRRFLEDRPIHARRPSLLEKATKWARRHRAVVAATLGALVLSVAGLSATTMVIAHAYDRERQKAHEADVQRARAQESFRQARRAVDEFARIGEEELAGNPATEGPRRRVLEAALSYYQDFVDQRRDDPSTRQELEASRAKVERLIAELATLMDAGKYDLLRQVVVQDELALSQDQRRSIVRMNQKWRAALRGPGRPGPGEREQRRMSLAHAQETDVAALLSPGQARRFRQIALQAEGPRAFLDPEVVTKLELTPAQREQIHAIAADAFVAGPCSPRLPPSAVDRADDGDGPPQEMGLPRVIALLTAEQVQRWKEMTGKPFTGRLQWPPLPSEPFGAPPPDQTRIRPKPIIPCMALLS